MSDPAQVELRNERGKPLALGCASATLTDMDVELAAANVALLDRACEGTGTPPIAVHAFDWSDPPACLAAQLPPERDDNDGEGGLGRQGVLVVGRGLNSLPFPLNFSLPCPFPLNLRLLCPLHNLNYPSMWPEGAQVEL